MRNSEFCVDFSKVTGRIKPLNGVGQPPMISLDTSAFRYLTEANIPYSRLHDVGGWFGGNMYVDIPNIFRNFDADENNPASYDFAFTDIIIKALVESGCEPYYRLGVTIENFHKIKAYRIYPPADYGKWARICEHIIRHYNEGWADGFYYNIKYWEIWNEPDGAPNNGENELQSDSNENAMWKGTREEFYDLYRVTAKHLRACFGDSIRIGGYGSCGFYIVNSTQTVDSKAFGGSGELSDWDKRIRWFYIFFKGFVDMVKEENLPFDFFSHHSYAGVEDTVRMQQLAERELEVAGLGNVEIHLNEWNTHNERSDRGTSKACANAAAMLLAMHKTKCNIMCYYDARIAVSVFGGLFDPMTAHPVSTYYAMLAFGKLRALGNEAFSEVMGDGLYALAAVDDDGNEKAVMLSNIGEDALIKTNISNGRISVLNGENFLTESELNCSEFVLKKDNVCLIMIY